jgi:ribonuclease J
VHDKMAPVHCSGHASQAEQAELLSFVRPRSFVPVHGERVMLEAHARLAKASGIDPGQVLVVEDGQTLVLRDGRLARGPSEPVSRRPVDAGGKVLDWGDVRDRNKLGRGGLVVCSLALDPRGALVAAPAITSRGLSLGGPLTHRLERAVRAAVVDAAQARLEDTEALGRAVRLGLRAVLKDDGRRPEVTVHVVRVNS